MEFNIKTAWSSLLQTTQQMGAPRQPEKSLSPHPIHYSNSSLTALITIIGHKLSADLIGRDWGHAGGMGVMISPSNYPQVISKIELSLSYECWG